MYIMHYILDLEIHACAAKNTAYEIMYAFRGNILYSEISRHIGETPILRRIMYVEEKTYIPRCVYMVKIL